jgi:hypothetical protein
VSARPSVPRLEGEELDLLISRSLDGDLSPEETRDLETVLANDPAARKRRDELAGLVAETRALPAPAPPFALATRVNSNVSEKTARGGSVFHRFGFYPPPGTAIGAMVVLGVVAVAITVLNPAPRPVGSTVARRADGPVEVFFQEGKRAKDAVQDAAKGAEKKAAPPSGEPAGAKIASKAKAREEGAAARSAPAVERPETPDSILESKQAASVVASNEPVLDEKQNTLAKSEADADKDRTRRAAADAPALSAAAPQAAGGIAPAAPAPPARAMRSLNAHTWSVAIRGEGARRWMLRRAPEGRPSAASASSSSFRVTLDAEGRVTAVRALDARVVHPALLEFVRGLVFAPLESALGKAAGSVADGFTRDREQRAKDDRVDAPENPSEIEVEVSAH